MRQSVFMEEMMGKRLIGIVTFIGVLFLTLSVNATQTIVLDVPGQIAYVRVDHNIYTLNFSNGDPTILTDDASLDRRYQYPVWSDNNKLAYFCCDPAYSTIPRTQVYISPNGSDSGKLAYDESGAGFTYAFWSPGECASSQDCRDLAVLLSRASPPGLSVELIRSSENNVESKTLGTGSPFYYSWSPDASRIFAQRNLRQFDIFDVNSDTTQSLIYRPGRIQAPQWSPIDDRLLAGILNEDGMTDLVIIEDNSIQILKAGLTDAVAYNWSPDGNYVAYRTVTARGQLSQVFVVDVVTGDAVGETLADGVISFFWSPNSEHLAYITLATPRGSFNAHNPSTIPVSFDLQETEGFAWSVLDIQTGDARSYGAFLPTLEMVYVLSFFDQFSQSHRIWSRDSAYLVYSEIAGDDEMALNIIDARRPDSSPIFVADGVIGFWSQR
jgi:Tol biopolymer transport system component